MIDGTFLICYLIGALLASIIVVYFGFGFNKIKIDPLPRVSLGDFVIDETADGGTENKIGSIIEEQNSTKDGYIFGVMFANGRRELYRAGDKKLRLLTPNEYKHTFKPECDAVIQQIINDMRGRADADTK